jgi:hypothetical protein
MDDLTTLWVKKVLDHQDISDAFKLRFFEELFLTDLNEDTVEHAFKVWRGSNIPSANVRKIKYDDETKQMVIQFQDKSIYTYFDVPFDVFLGVTNGDATCTTDGKNRYGSWEVGKTPSVGSAVWKFLIRKKIKYQRGGTLK